jgi:arginyl-tRNA synthetase
MNIEQLLRATISQVLTEKFDLSIAESGISLQPTKKEFEGNYTFVVFPFVKQLRQSPAALGQAIGEGLQQRLTWVSGYNVVQGFLNISVDNSAWMSVWNSMLEDSDFGVAQSNGRQVMVEYSSPNTNKPLHLGHLRNNFLGFSVAQILKANGYTVKMTNIVNNRGIHICKSMLAYQLSGQKDTPENTGLKGDKLVGKYYVEFDKLYKAEIAELVAAGKPQEEAEKTAPAMLAAQEMLRKWEAQDPDVLALWHQMNSWVYAGFDETYQKLGVNFDQIYYESDTYLLGKKTVEEGLAAGVFFKKNDGSVWIDLSAEGLDQKLLLRSDGTSVYITQDLGLADQKYADFPMEQSVYVVGNEQDYHFEVLFKIMKKLGRGYADGLFHLSYGMVDLPSGKMKSREGTVVDADDLIEEMVETAAETTRELGKIEGLSPSEADHLHQMLALGALKYFLLKVDPKKRMLFNPQESIDFQGHTGPYIQYNHARICAILRKAAQLEVASITHFPTDLPLHATEQTLIFQLSTYPSWVSDAARQYSPSLISQFVYQLAKSYSQFYSEVSIFQETDPTLLAFRIALSGKVAEVLRKGMGLLGIEVPERM